MPRVSVIVPTIEEESVFGLVRSLRKALGKDAEIIIVDKSSIRPATISRKPSTTSMNARSALPVCVNVPVLRKLTSTPKPISNPITPAMTPSPPEYQ